MAPSCAVTNSILMVFSVMQLGLISTMAEEEIMVLGVVGEQVLLPCIRKSQPDKVEWKYKETVVIRYQPDQILKGRAPMTQRSQINKQETPKGNFSMTLSQLEPSDAGTYVCEVGSQKSRVQLEVFKVTVSPTEYLLHNEKLMLKIEGSSSASITWFDNHKNPVTDQPQLRELKDRGHSLHIYNLRIEDSGTWRCHITSKSANLDIPYNVQVIGFSNNWRPERRYASVNSTISFPYTLNNDLRKIRERETITGALQWKQKEDSDYQEKFKLTDPPSKEPYLSEKINRMELTGKINNLTVKLLKVQFEDAGWYRCYFTFSRRTVEKAIYLVLMTVSANPVGPLSKGANVTLLCRLSAPLPSEARLLWKHMNRTENASQTEGQEVRVTTNTTGQWRCSLEVNNKVEISMDYTVVKAAERNNIILIVAEVGAGIMLLLLASLCTFTYMAWQRRRRWAEKRAQIRQDLLEKRTCQCQRRLKNNYTNA